MTDNVERAKSLFFRGTALFDRSDFVEAERSFMESLALVPDRPSTLANLAATQIRLRKYHEAKQSAQRSVLLDHSNVGSWYDLGSICVAQRAFEEALSYFDRVIELKPDYAEAYISRGKVLGELKRFEDALANYDMAIELKPDLAAAHNNRGSALQALQNFEEALADFDKAIELSPDFAEAHSNRGNCLEDFSRLEEALAAYDRAIELRPGFAEAHSNRGNCLKSLQRPKEALAAYNMAVELDPETPEPRWNRSLVLLQIGNFQEGWKEYEWRWKSASSTTKLRDFGMPLWLGDASIEGKRILLHAEQGFGDSIQFARYIPMVAALGAEVVVEVQAPLKSLFSGIRGVSKVIAAGEELPAFDVHCPMLSLALAFKTEFDSIPHGVPYLSSDGNLTSKFAGLLPKTGKKLVGMAWAGRQTFGGDRSRSIGLQRIAPLLDVAGCHFIGIQKDLRVGDAELLSTMPNLTWVGDKLADFSDTAALMSMLDLIISSDTSVVHLAGALARPTWVLLEHNPDWRWRINGTDNPWYPTARLFRQERRDEWKPVLEAAADALRAIAR